jgi:hypothetical protein
MLSLEKSIQLKDDFFQFAQNKDINKEIKKEAEKEGVKEINGRFTEWFLFEKVFPDGKTTIDLFLEKDFSEEEIEMVSSWKKFVFSIFKLKKEDNEQYVLLNIVNNHKYIVYKQGLNKTINVGDYFITRLLPFYKDYIFSNILHKIDSRSNDQIYNIAAQFELDYPHAAFFDNENKMQVSYRIQSLEYEDFVDFFGSDEIIVEGHEIPRKLHEFYHYRYFQKKEKNSGKTIAKIFREKYGTYPDLPLIELPASILELGEVGIVYDKIEGLNFFPWYGIFRDIFRNKEFRDFPGYKKCVLEYLKSESISTLPFRKVIRENPEISSEVFKDLLNRKTFKIPDDFEKLMEKYKKSIMTTAKGPTVIPMPERTKALLRTKRPEEYGSLNFSGGANKYKDIHNRYQLEE